MDNEMISTADAAQLLQMSKRRIQSMAAEGKLTIRQRIPGGGRGGEGIILLDRAEIEGLARQRVTDLRRQANAISHELTHQFSDTADQIRAGRNRG